MLPSSTSANTARALSVPKSTPIAYRLFSTFFPPASSEAKQFFRNTFFLRLHVVHQPQRRVAILQIPGETHGLQNFIPSVEIQKRLRIQPGAADQFQLPLRIAGFPQDLADLRPVLPDLFDAVL